MRKVLYGENDEYFWKCIAHVKMIGSLITKIWFHSTLLKIPIWKLVNILSKIVTLCGTMIVKFQLIFNFTNFKTMLILLDSKFECQGIEKFEMTSVKSIFSRFIWCKQLVKKFLILFYSMPCVGIQSIFMYA